MDNDQPARDASLALYLRRDIDASPLDAPEGSLMLPLASEVAHNLWQGGTPATVGTVPAYFRNVLCLYPWESYMRHEGTEVRVAPLMDDPDGRVPSAKIEELARWVNEKRAEGPVLVHCQLGLNRSGLVNATALMQEGRTADEAIALLREKRSPVVLFNRTFEQWLRQRERAA